MSTAARSCGCRPRSAGAASTPATARSGRCRAPPAPANRSQPTVSSTPHRVRRLGGRARRRRRSAGSVNAHAERVRQLAGDPAHGHLVPAVRGDLHARAARRRARPPAGRRRPARPAVRRQHDDAGVVVAEAQLARPSRSCRSSCARTSCARRSRTRRAARRRAGSPRPGRRRRSWSRRRRSPAAAGRRPTSTRQKRIGFLKPVSSSIFSTRPTTRSPLTVAAWSTIDSTSMPRSTSASLELGGGQRRPAGRRTRAARTATIFIAQTSMPNVAGEPHVALDHVAHVADPVAEHQRPLDAHAEREAASTGRGRCRRRAAPAG